MTDNDRPGSKALQPGQPAPDFHLLDERGYARTLADVSGAEGLVLVFFPTIFLPGDIKLLSHYAKTLPDLQARGINVAAISGLNWETLHDLHRKLDLPYPVLFDPCCRVAKQYHCMWIPRFLNGRGAFYIDAGRVVQPLPRL